MLDEGRTNKLNKLKNRKKKKKILTSDLIFDPLGFHEWLLKYVQLVKICLNLNVYKFFYKIFHNADKIFYVKII